MDFFQFGFLVPPLGLDTVPPSAFFREYDSFFFLFVPALLALYEILFSFFFGFPPEELRSFRELMFFGSSG